MKPHQFSVSELARLTVAVKEWQSENCLRRRRWQLL